jgi:hypothetical protein
MSNSLLKGDSKNTPYTPSGNTGNIAIGGLIVGPILVMLCSSIYAFIAVFLLLDDGVFLFFLLLFFIFGLINLFWLVFRFFKCRSNRASIIFGCFFGLLAIHSSWVSFLSFFDEEGYWGYFELFINPRLVWEKIILLNESGRFFKWGDEPEEIYNGGWLWFWWSAEAVAILLAGFLGGWLFEGIFCERCNGWADDIDFNLRLAINDKEAVKSMIENNINGLLELPAATDLQSEHIRVDIYRCTKCEKTTALRVKFITINFQKDKEEGAEEQTLSITSIFVISEDQFEAFKQKETRNKV